MDKVLISESILSSIGEAIRGKNGEVDLYAPSTMANKIRELQGSSGTDTSDGTATENDVLEGKVAYSQGVRLVGTIQFGTIYTGSEDPDSSIGVDGDVYIKIY